MGVVALVSLLAPPPFLLFLILLFSSSLSPDLRPLFPAVLLQQLQGRVIPSGVLQLLDRLGALGLVFLQPGLEGFDAVGVECGGGGSYGVYTKIELGRNLAK